MDLIKKLTGKNPIEYEAVAKSLVNNSDKELFAKLVKQDDFLFDFIKDNVAKRIQSACNKNNYKNLLSFLEYYSPSYDTMIASVLHSFGGEEIFEEMKVLFLNGTDEQKAYVVKYFTFVNPETLSCLLSDVRNCSESQYEPLALNSIELLSVMQDDVSRQNALTKLESTDEFVQFEGVKFLVNYQAKECLPQIIDVMKNSSLAENIACEIPYLISFDEMFELDSENALLVLCNIINAIPEILPVSNVNNFGLVDIFDKLINETLTSSSAVVLRLAKDRFEEFVSNEEYLFDCDKNTKDDVFLINEMLKKINTNKLDSFLYDELFEDSDFVFFALDYVNEVQELEALLDSKNQTLILKVLTLLKDKKSLNDSHKEIALQSVTSSDIISVIKAL